MQDPMEEEEEMLLNLPEEILVDILHRVPLESLVQYKKVCKPWLDLISNCNFAHAHLVSSSQVRSSMIIEFLCATPSIHNYYTMEFHDFELKQFKIYLELQQQFKDGVLLRASCNGLLLLQSNGDANQLFICNPITRHCKKLPVIDTGHEHIWQWVLLLDSSLDPKYKVVGITMNSDRCFVLKLGESGSNWKELQTPYRDSRVMSTLPLVLVHNEFHWLATAYSLESNGSSKHRYKPCIYSMNAAIEELRFRETSIPSMIDCNYDCCSIIEVEGSLGLTVPVSCYNHLDIWTLHESDWIKKYSIPLDSEIGNNTHVYSFPGSRFLLIHYKNRLVFYDLEKKDSRQVSVSDEPKLISRFLFLHTDSLVKWD